MKNIILFPNPTLSPQPLPRPCHPLLKFSPRFLSLKWTQTFLFSLVRGKEKHFTGRRDEPAKQTCNWPCSSAYSMDWKMVRA